jgi:FkbM family methyltransferase
MLKKLLIKFFAYLGFSIKVNRLQDTTIYKKKSDVLNLDFYDTPTGKYYLPKNINKDYVANSIKRGEIFDEEIIEVANQYLHSNGSILDIGANYGQMTVLFSKAVQKKGNGKVFSFEAEPFVGEILKSNVYKNNCNNVELVLNAVHHTSGLELIFPEPDLKKFESYGSYGIAPNANGGRKVATVAIDEMDIKEEICFIKVDIQGSDLFALQGAKKTILKNKPAIIFEYEEQFQEEFKTSFQDYVEFVESINYKFVRTYMDINYLILPR